MRKFSVRFHRFLAREYWMTMEDFCRETGVSRSAVLNIINGRATPTIGTRRKLLKIVNANQLEDMIGGLYAAD